MKALDKFNAVRARSSLRSLFLIVACWMAICAVHGQEPTTAALAQSKQRLTTKDPATAQKSDTVSTDPLAELSGVGGQWIVPPGTEMATRPAQALESTPRATQASVTSPPEASPVSSESEPESAKPPKKSESQPALSEAKTVPLPRKQTTLVGTIEEIESAKGRVGKELILATEDGLATVIVPPTTAKELPAVGTKIRIKGTIETEDPLQVYATNLEVLPKKGKTESTRDSEMVEEEEKPARSEEERTGVGEGQLRIVVVGTIKSARPAKDGRDLEITLATKQYGQVRVLISPNVAQRVPAVGSEIRVRGAIERQRDPMIIRAFDVDTLRRRSEATPLENPVFAECPPIVVPVPVFVAVW